MSRLSAERVGSCRCTCTVVRELALFCLLLLSGGAAALPQATTTDAPLPRPDLSDFDDGATRRIEQLLEELETIAAPAAGSDVEDDVGNESATLLGELGNAYHALELYETALAHYSRAITNASDPTRWHYYRGVLHQSRGDLDSATEDFERVLESWTDHRPTLERLGEIAVRQGRFTDAREAFERSLASGAASAVASAGLARAARGLGDDEEAVRRFRQALAIQPQASLLHYQLGLVLRDLGELDAAREELGRAGDREVAFSDPLLGALVPRSVGFLLEQGGRAAAAGDLDAAIELFRRAKELAPEDLNVMGALAGALIARGETTESLELHRTMVSRAPEWPRGHLQLALALARARQSPEEHRDEILEHLTMTTRLDDNLGTAFQLLGQELLVAGETDAARDALERAIAIDPRDHEARWAMSEILLRDGDGEAALTELRTLEESSYELARVLVDQASALLQLGRHQEARETLARASRLENVSPAERALALFSLGNLELAEDNPDAAVAAYQEAIDNDPGGRDLHFNLATALLRLGSPKEAALSFERALQVDPDDEPAIAGLARAQALESRFAEAHETLTGGLDRKNDSVVLLEAFARLLAAAPEDSVRDEETSLVLAQRVFGAERSLRTAETLAMALAANGRFGDALTVQRQVVQQAERTGQPPATRAALQDNLERYERSEPPRYRP